MTLVGDFDILSKKIKQTIYDKIKQASKEIQTKGEEIFRGYVPIDTELLKQNIKFEIHEINSDIKLQFEIRGEVQNKDIRYEKNVINAIILGNILMAGKSKSGKELRRTKSNTFASAGSPTADWFENANEAWVKSAEKILRKNFK